MASKTEEEQKLLELLKLKRALERGELKDTEQYKTTVKQVEILQEKVKEHQKGILKYFGDTNKAATALRGSLKEMGNSMKQIGQIWAATDFTNIGTTLLRQNVEIEKSLHRTLVNSGKFGPSLKEAEKNVIELRTQFGATYQEAAEVVKTLSEKQYIGNLKEAADSSFLFARATGMGKEEVAQLTVALQKEGKISGTATTAMYADLLKIQQSNGMTKEGMKATTDQIVKMASQMRAFGKSEGEIRQMAAATGRLVSSFEKVGISAQEATQWINKMLDPEQIEDNIKSYAALGISMTDALTGNIDQGQLETGLKEFGEKVKAMGPIAGKAYAQAMGISYSMAIKATDAEKATEEALTPEESAAKSLETLTEATQSMHEKIGEVFNKVEGTLQNLPNSILAAMGVLGPQLAKAITGAFDSAFNKVEKRSKTASDRIADQFAKGSLKAKDVMQVSMDELYSHLDGQSEDVKAVMEGKIAEAFGKISKTAKGMNWFKEQDEGINKTIKSLKTQEQELTKNRNITKDSLDVLEKQINDLNEQKNLTGRLTAEQSVNLATLLSKQSQQKKYLEEIDLQYNGLEKSIGHQEELQKRLNSMLNAGKIEINSAKEAQEELNGAIEAGNKAAKNKVAPEVKPKQNLKIDNLELKKDSTEGELKNVSESLKILKEKENVRREELRTVQEKLNAMSQAEKLSKEELKKRKDLITQEKNIKKVLSDISKEKTSIQKKEEETRKSLEKTTKELEKEKKIQEMMASGMSRFKANMIVSKADMNMKAGMFKGKISGAIGGTVGKVKDKVANSRVGGAVGKVAGKVGSIAGGIGGAIGKVMKVLGPIGAVVTVIGMLLSKSEKFQKMIQKIQEKVVEPIMKHIGEIFDQIDFDAITDVLCALLPPVLKVISWALKPIVFVLNLIATGIKKLLKVFNKSIDTEQQIAENTSDSSGAMTVGTSTDGSVRTYNVSNGEANSSSDSSENSSKTIASKPKNSSDTKVDNSEGGGFFKGLADTFVKATPFGALSTGIEQIGEIAKEIIEMKKEQNSMTAAKQQSLADSIRMGIDGATFEMKDGKDTRMLVLDSKMFGNAISEKS